METAIKKAIEGGYLSKIFKNYTPEWTGLKLNIVDPETLAVIADWRPKEILLDPLFWQALGKAEGWKENQWPNCVCGHRIDCHTIAHVIGKSDLEHETPDGEGCLHCICKHFHNNGKYRNQFEIEWHRFIDHLIEGKDADSFFKGLLE